WDRVIDRQVLLEDCDASRILMLRRFAQADHPFLQAVYALDEAEGRAILESPRGVALSSFEPDDPRRIGALMQARAALRSLHDAELAHGAIEGASILVAEGRAVLLLPRPRDPELRPEPASMLEGARDDLRALERLGWSESASIQPASGAPARLPPGSGPSAREESS
ncbi:MAG: hypothetical protein OEY14_00455, partial [Myxococcales bacterium]|nr:hypothetical protein [Myxococcales bacterium]